MIPEAKQIQQLEKRGYIVENGSNDNGEYIKFSDGTMIAYGTKTMNVSYSTVAFPVSFVETPKMLVSLNTAVSNDSIYIVSTNATSGTSANIFARKNDGTAVASEISVTWQAIGKWK